jgi:transposase-like protein
MSRLAKERNSRRPRRRFDDDFKAQTVRLVLDEGKTVGGVARERRAVDGPAFRRVVI